MATSFPGGLDAFTNPTSGDTLDSPDHAAQHADVNDAVEALQAKVGVDGSAVATSLDYIVNSGQVNNAATADALSTSRTISLTGDVTGSTSFDGSANVSLATSLAAATGKLVKWQYYSNSTVIYSPGTWTTFLSGSYTPLSASNTLVIIATPVVSLYNPNIEFYAAGTRIASYDREDAADFGPGGRSFHPPYLYSVNAGSTSARTYSFQFFSDYANADNNASSCTSSMLILELAP